MTEPNPYKDGGDYQWGPTQPPGAPDGYGYPQAPLAPMGGSPGAPLLALGDITVLQNSVITPNGTMPLKGAVWNCTDMSRTEEKIPTVGIVLAVVFAVFCLLGLLFLLMKERRTTGFIQISVTSAGRHHSTMIPATGPDTIHWVVGQIGYARSLSA
ncbi:MULTISPECIES: hypothetical protein [Streptomyces]|uniref:Uncharacterized protein n=1 Tax=Streptomyces pratisoli TaxID=3139917 RepID=A0ACC6QLM5_9ACTN|nr:MULTISPECIES: hypothetical protein [unclassified Streptomyces]MCX4512788.1 hypothetical protein [Streptomyces sp. NBC_01619]